MKRMICTLILLMIFCTQVIPFASADESFFSLSDLYLQKSMDMSKRQSIELSASGSNPDVKVITFDFTEGNHTIVIIDGDRCKVYYHFEDEELWSIVFFMMTQFTSIESQLPTGKALLYELHLSETNKLFITSETLSMYYSWMQ